MFIPTGVDVASGPVLGEAKIEEDVQKSTGATKLQYCGNILVAEDHPSNQKLIELLLKRLGLEVFMVENGQEAVEVALSQSFDIIFIDGI